MSTPYAAIPVGPDGLEEDRAQLVFGTPLRDTLTRQELSRRVAVLLVENDLLRRGRSVDAEQALARMDNESALRLKAQQRLNKVAFCFAAIVRRYPETAEIIDAARDEIWDLR